MNVFYYSSYDMVHLSKRARENEFAGLTADEVARIEGLYASTFGGSGASRE